jgi:aminoglycoside phosphotransferase (APT) family kinase protein
VTPEPLDIEDADALVAYLRAEGRIGAEEATPRVRVLAGGVSNKTVLVERASGEAWVLKQALPKLRVKTDWFSDPARIHREAEALRWLPKLAPPGTITPLAFEDPPRHLLAMEAVPQPHENWKTMLLAGRVDVVHVAKFGEILATIHALSAGEPHLAAAFDDRSFFESLRLEAYYAYAAERVPAAANFLRELIGRTRATRVALVHGDYSPKNVLVRNGPLVLLDHEVIHYGDPAFDLGFALTHFLSKANHLPEHRARFQGAADVFLTAYWQTVLYLCDGEAKGGIGPGRDDGWCDGMTPMVVNHALGCLLARVAGRSPLEYLAAPQRERQQAAVLSLIARPPTSERRLVAEFLERL